MRTRTIYRLHPELYLPVMNEAKKVYSIENKFSVFAFGIGSKIRKGISQKYNCLRVFVEKKNSIVVTAVRAIEIEHDGTHYKIIPDVTAIGRRPRLNDGKEIEFNGLHPGSVIRVDLNGVSIAGGANCILTDRRDPTHLLTAGHLFCENAEGAGVFSGIGRREFLCGELVYNMLDEDTSDFGTDIDAALVELNDAGQELAYDSRGEGPIIQGIASVQSAQPTQVQSFLPTCNNYSPVFSLSQSTNVIRINAPARKRLIDVNDSLHSNILVSDEGDSGTLAFSHRGDPKGIGICIADMRLFSVFEPLARAMEMVTRRYPYLKLF